MLEEPIDLDIFEPFAGGAGVRVTCTTTASAPVGIPGATAFDQVRFRIVNGGNFSAFIRIAEGDYADLGSMEILPGTVEMFKKPYSYPHGVTISGITESGQTTISIVAGRGF